MLAGAALVGLPLGGDCSGLGLLLAAVAAVSARQGAVVWSGGHQRQGLLTMAVAGAIMALGVTLTWRMSHGDSWRYWALAMALTGGAQVMAAWLLPRRPWQLSACAGLSFALLAGAIAAAGGAPTAWSAIATAVLTGHFAIMVPVVRAQTRRDAGWLKIAVRLHLVWLLGGVVAWTLGWVSIGILGLGALDLGRTVLLVHVRTPMSAKTAVRIGSVEMAWIAVLAALLVVTLRLGC